MERRGGFDPPSATGPVPTRRSESKTCVSLQTARIPRPGVTPDRRGHVSPLGDCPHNANRGGAPRHLFVRECQMMTSVRPEFDLKKMSDQASAIFPPEAWRRRGRRTRQPEQGKGRARGQRMDWRALLDFGAKNRLQALGADSDGKSSRFDVIPPDAVLPAFDPLRGSAPAPEHYKERVTRPGPWHGSRVGRWRRSPGPPRPLPPA